MKGIEKWKHVKLWMMCHLLLGYLKKHFHAWHKVRHLCKGTACYQTSNHLRRVKRWKQENHLVDFGGWPACKLGSHIARCAGGSCASLAGWQQKGFQLSTMKCFRQIYFHLSSPRKCYIDILSKFDISQPCCRGCPALKKHLPISS